MRIFLDANVLFSAAKSDGAVRMLLRELDMGGHALVCDEYVAAEARKNLELKANADAAEWLQALLARIEVRVAAPPAAEDVPAVDWLPEKDRPVLGAAIASRCDALVTGDRTHFGPGYGKTFDGVTVFSPAGLAQKAWGRG